MRAPEPSLLASAGDAPTRVGEPGQPAAEPRQIRGRPWVHGLLFAATLLTTVWAGALHQGANLLVDPWAWALGLPYALALLAILAVHEMGHYIVARRRGIAVSLPYFIPAPFWLGTFGAFIRMGGRIADRRAYFDVAIAGPLAGLVVAMGAVLIGATAEPMGMDHGMTPSSSFLFALLYKLAGVASVDAPVRLGPIAFAGWLGLLVTALNLLPLGQLDGGHIAYGLLGRAHARGVGVAVLLGLMIVGGLLVSPHWLMWGLIAWALAGVEHPPAVNELAALGAARTMLGLLTAVVFLLIILPWPW